jgi:hypothetical protein
VRAIGNKRDSFLVPISGNYAINPPDDYVESYRKFSEIFVFPILRISKTKRIVLVDYSHTGNTVDRFFKTFLEPNPLTSGLKIVFLNLISNFENVENLTKLPKTVKTINQVVLPDMDGNTSIYDLFNGHFLRLCPKFSFTVWHWSSADILKNFEKTENVNKAIDQIQIYVCNGKYTRPTLLSKNEVQV